MTEADATLDSGEVGRYLERIDLERPVEPTAATLARLQFAHLVAVPFENLDIVFAGGVAHDRRRSFEKIVSGRGGWCFELNGAFSLLLEALGFEVSLLGAAVLLDGPTTIVGHVALEVGGTSDDAGVHLVDVGFGASFIRPLDINRGGPQDGGSATFELLASPQGTTLAEHVDEVPAARYRFKRVAHRFDDFEPIAASMQTDPAKHWSHSPFATRLLGHGADRVTLLRESLEVERDGTSEKRPVARAEWDALLAEWFDMERPGPWPDEH